MWLNQAEQRTLKTLIREQLVSAADPYPSLKAVFRDFADSIRLGETPALNARIVLQACIGRGLGGTTNPPILQLLEFLVEDVGAPLTDLHDRLSEQRAALVAQEPQDAFSVQLLYGRQAFFDRKVLRQALAELTHEHGPCVLTVSGPEKSGKSYSYHLIQHLAEEFDFGFAFAALDKLATPEDVLRYLAASIDRDLRPEPAARAEELTKWTLHGVHELLAEAAERRSGRWWFVLDGGATEHLPNVMHDLIAQLVEEILRTGRRWMRLILLDYDRPLTNRDLKPLLRNEQIQPIRPTHLQEFFTEYSRIQPEFLGGSSNPDAAIKQVVDALYRRAEKNRKRSGSEFILPFLTDVVHEAIDAQKA